MIGVWLPTYDLRIEFNSHLNVIKVVWNDLTVLKFIGIILIYYFNEDSIIEFNFFSLIFTILFHFLNCSDLTMKYTIKERVFLIKKFYELKSMEFVQRAWREKYQGKPIPDSATIRNIVSNFENTGSVAQ